MLYSSDPADLPLTDLDAAASLPYDTDIPDGAGTIQRGRSGPQQHSWQRLIPRVKMKREKGEKGEEGI